MSAAVQHLFMQSVKCCKLLQDIINLWGIYRWIFLRVLYIGMLTHSVEMSGTFLVKMFFVVEKENPSWMKARDQTRWRLASIQEKGINKESKSWHLEALSLLSVEPTFIRASNVRSPLWRYKRTTLTPTTSESVIFNVRWVCKPNRVGVMLCWVCMPSPRRWQAGRG